MPERHQHPFKKSLQPGAFLPVIVVEGFRFFKALVKMIDQLAVQAFMLTKQTDLMLVTEAAVIEIGRSDHKVFSVGQEKFGMQVLWKKKMYVHLFAGKLTQILA